MYEAVRARPAGPSTVARLALTASDYGYDGLVVVNPPDAPPGHDAAAIREAYDVDVVDGVELAVDGPSQAGGAIGRHRGSTTVLSVRGGDPSLNGYVVRQPEVDVLSRPMAGDGDLNHVLVRQAADRGVRLSVELGPLVRETGPGRSAAIAGLRKLRELVEAYDAPYVVTAGAASHLQLRAPRELAAVAAVAGFDRDAVERGLREWGRLAERNRERQSADYVAPGVRRGRGDDGA